MAVVWDSATRTWDDAIAWWGVSATRPRPAARAVLELVFRSGGVTAPFCVLSGTHQASWADGWVQADTVLAKVEGTTLPTGYHYGDLVTLQQASQDDPTNVLCGPFGRYRMIGVATPEYDPQTRRHYINLEAHDWVRALLDRAVSTSGITATYGVAAAIQLVDMLRGVLSGPVAPDADFLAAAATAFPGDPAPEQTWEYIILGVLWYLTGSTAATPWVVVDGVLSDLTETPHPIAARLDAFGVLQPRWDPWARLNYDVGVPWRQVLTELCAPKRPGRTSFGVAPITASYDAMGVLHLRRADERWWQGWGWQVVSDAHTVPLGLPVRQYAVTQHEPQYDRVRVWVPFADASVAAGYIVIALADNRANTSWYTWRADLERPLDEFIWIPGASLTDVTVPLHYAQQIADALLLQSLSAAYDIQLTLTQPWDYPQLGQEVQLFDPPAVSVATTLAAATTPLNGRGGTWTVRYRSDLA